MILLILDLHMHTRSIRCRLVSTTGVSSATVMRAHDGVPEATLLQEKNIAAALLFGRGHYEVGDLISPSNGISIPENNEEKRAEYIDSIWSVPNDFVVMRYMIITFAGRSSRKRMPWPLNTPTYRERSVTVPTSYVLRKQC